MKTKLITTIMIALFLASITIIAMPVRAAVLVVPDDYPTIRGRFGIHALHGR